MATKRENGMDFPCDDFAYCPDDAKPSTWKLRLTEEPGKVTLAQLKLACAAIGNGIAEADMAKIKRRLRQEYAKLGIRRGKLPPILQESGYVPMEGLKLVTLAESDPVLCEAFDIEWPDNTDLSEGEKPRQPMATLIREGLNKSETRMYTRDFLERCVREGRFSGSFSHADHPTDDEQRRKPERSLLSLAARTGEAYYDSATKSVKAPLVWLAEDVPGSAGSITKALFDDPIVRQRGGLSIYYRGPVQMQEAEHPSGGKRKIAVPVALGDDRKFDVDLVTQPGAGGSIPLLEADRKEAETPMTTEELDERFEALEARLTEALSNREPVPPAPPQETVTAPPVDTSLAEALAVVKAELATLKSDRWLADMIADSGLAESVRAGLHKQFTGRTFATHDEAQAAFAAAVETLTEAAKAAAGPRVADLNGAPAETPDDAKPVTFAEALGLEVK